MRKSSRQVPGTDKVPLDFIVASIHFYLTNMTYSPPTLTGAGHQRTVSTNTGCNQWLPLTKTLLKVALACRNHLLEACTSKCGWTISP